ncbi:MAG: hypothetical protein FJZ58_07645, partial [Chlamydiae bacterium]|nr:hypothetical protein [Chlamydiota bacterium]
MDSIDAFHRYTDVLLLAKVNDDVSCARKELGKLIYANPWLLYEVPQEQRELFVEKVSHSAGSSLETAQKVQGVARGGLPTDPGDRLVRFVKGVFHSKLSSQELQKAYSEPFTFLEDANLRAKAGPRVLIEVAKKATAQDARRISENIGNYEIQDQAALIEIAKMAVAQDEWGVSENIKNYGIQDQAALIEIAKMAVAQSGLGVSCYIKNYGIQDQAALVEIAKIAAAQSRWEASFDIKNYGIQDKNALIEIAKIATRANPLSVLKNLGQFISLKDPSLIRERESIIVSALLHWVVKEGKRFIDSLSAYPHLAPYLPGKALLSSQEGARGVFIACVQHNSLRILPENIWDVQGRNMLFDKVVKYRNQPIAASLVSILFEQADSPAYKTAYTSLVEEEEKWVAHKLLPAIVPARWMVQGNMGKEDPDMQLLTSFLKLKREAFRNNLSPLLQTYLLAALELDQIEELTPQRKLLLLARVCASEDPVKGLGLLRALCSRKATSELISCPMQDPIGELKVVFERELIKGTFVDLSGIENLSDRYQETFGKTRVPSVLETYTAGLRSLGDESIRKILERFVRSVLLGTFQEERYKLENNLHLQCIHQHDPALLSKWKSLVLEAPVISMTASQKKKVFSLEEFFKTKMQDHHWHLQEQDQLPVLTQFLQAPQETRGKIVEDLEGKIQECQNKIQIASSHSEKKDLGLELKSYQMQKICMELVMGVHLSSEEQLKKLQSLSSQMTGKGLELEHDIKGLVRELESPTT